MTERPYGAKTASVRPAEVGRATDPRIRKGVALLYEVTAVVAAGAEMVVGVGARTSSLK